MTAPQETAPHPTAPHPVQEAPPTGREAEHAAPLPATAAAPKVSLWADDDYSDGRPARRRRSPRQRPRGGRRRTGGSRPGDTADRAPGNFPASARAAADDEGDYEEYEEDSEPRREPRSTRWLVGGLLAAVLVVGLIFAVTNLGSLFKSSPQTNAAQLRPQRIRRTEQPPHNRRQPPARHPLAGPPAIEGVTRLGNFDFAGNYDSDLVKTFDGNGASFWSDMEFATEDWGGLASEVPLVVKLKGPPRSPPSR